MTVGAPFPFLRHGVGTADDLRLWVVLANPSTTARAVIEHFDDWAGRYALVTSHRVDGPLAWLRAKGLRRLSPKVSRSAHSKLDAVLVESHASEALALVARDNRVTLSRWHAETIIDQSAVVGALERVVCRPGPYTRPGALVVGGGGGDLRDLMMKTIHGCLKAELVNATLVMLRRSATTKNSREVLHDVLLERLPAMLGFDFDTDVVLREVIAVVSGLSSTSIEMTPRFHAEVAERMNAAHRNASRWLPRSSAKLDWCDVRAVREAIKAAAWRALETGLDDTNAAHAKALLALRYEERLALAAHGQLALLMANVAVRQLACGDFGAAMALYDAAVESNLPAGASANPLYAVQDDNHHLGVDAARAHRYLERCLPQGPANPTVFLNASFVWMELGAQDEAVQALAQAKKHGISIKEHRNERLFLPLRARADFIKLMRG